MKNKDRLMYLEETSEHMFDRIAALEASVAILQERDKERMEKAAQSATLPTEKPSCPTCLFSELAAVEEPCKKCFNWQRWKPKPALTPDKLLILRDLRDRIRQASVCEFSMILDNGIKKTIAKQVDIAVINEVLEVLDQIFGGEA